MNKKVVVIEPDGDLHRQVWEFWYSQYEHTLYLDEYQEQTRETKRAGWKTTNWYYRLNRRDCRLNAEQVPLPDSVKERALAEFMDGLKVEAVFSR